MINATFGWAWITVGLAGGLGMALFFAREDWLGGYPSWPRRLLRLGHVACVGLGALNVLFAVSAVWLHLPRLWLRADCGLWIAGAVTMPLACVIAAARPKWPALVVFAVPLACLLAAGAVTAWGMPR
jgi:hypothetical protein